jgi:uncharacterized protein
MPSSRASRHIPQRSCIACRTVRPQATLLRLSLDAAGRLTVNARQPQGRSAYSCPAPACLERALRRPALARALRRERLEVDPVQVRHAAALAESH